MTDLSRTLEILDRLVAFPTVSCDSNLDLIDWVQEFLQTAGFEVARIWSPNRQKAGLFARIGPIFDGGVCLSAHTDVVPVEGQVWTRPPFKLTDEGDCVFGRGTTDMKGFLGSALALAGRAGKTTLSAPLSLSISYDEEIGCVGIRHMMPKLKTLIGIPRLVIVGEPTSMQVATGHKGKAAFKVTCHGQAGHSALAPEFVNAIHIAADFVSQTRVLQCKLAAGAQDDAYSIPYSTVHIGKIAGGRALNIVPDNAQLDMEFHHLFETSADEIQHEIEDIAKHVSNAYPQASPITVDPINAYPGLQINPSDATVLWATKLAEASGSTKVSFGTEAGFFVSLGLTTVVIGPGNMVTDGHQPDEGLSKADLLTCDVMLNNILSELTV